MKFDKAAAVKKYPMHYGRIFRKAEIKFPLDITYDYETRYANIDGIYEVIEDIQYEQKKPVKLMKILV